MAFITAKCATMTLVSTGLMNINERGANETPDMFMGSKKMWINKEDVEIDMDFLFSRP